MNIDPLPSKEKMWPPNRASKASLKSLYTFLAFDHKEAAMSHRGKQYSPFLFSRKPPLVARWHHSGPCRPFRYRCGDIRSRTHSSHKGQQMPQRKSVCIHQEWRDIVFSWAYCHCDSILVAPLRSTRRVEVLGI